MVNHWYTKKNNNSHNTDPCRTLLFVCWLVDKIPRKILLRSEALH